MTTLPYRVSAAALIARAKLPAALDALIEAAAWLDAHACTPVIDAECAEAAGIGNRWETVDPADLGNGVDVVIAFGGDGTLLNAARVVAHSSGDAPLMGVNLGRLGFLTEVTRADMLTAFQAMIDGRSRIETRLMLEGIVEREGAIVGRRLALNDIVVTRGALSRMTELTVDVDGHFVCHVRADGLIVATPTGSTAYNLSAGGPIVHPALDAIVLTPIAPHTLTQRPLVLSASARIELRPLVEPPSDTLATFDGQFGIPLAAGDVVEIGRAPRLLRLLHTAGRSHFEMLREKLKWGHS